MPIDDNPWQAVSDGLSLNLVETRLDDVEPLVMTMLDDLPVELDPETSEVDVDTLPQPLRHYVVALSTLEAVKTHLRATGNAIDPSWIPPRDRDVTVAGN